MVTPFLPKVLFLSAMEADNNEGPESPNSLNDKETPLESTMHLIEEMKSFKKYFNINNCIEALLMKFLLPANDIISDFLIADGLSKVENDKNTISQWFTFFAYFFIACPGFMFLFSIVGKQIKGFIWPFLFMACFFCLEAILVYFSDAHLWFPLAIIVASLTLGIGFLDIFIHGPRMKNLSNLIAGYEGRYESAPQFLIHLALLISGEKYFFDSGLNFYGLFTSLVMLGNDLTENILMSESFQKKSFIKKLDAMSSIILVVIFTTIFRLGTLALAIHHIFVLDVGFYLIPLKLVIIVIPVIGVFLVQHCYETKKISVPECFVGIIGELSAFYNWRAWGDDMSRKVQFMLNIYYSLLYGSYCIWIAWNSPNENAGTFAVVFLCSGWVSFPLFISQIFMKGMKDEDEEEIEEDDSHDISQNNEVITYI